MNCTNCGASLDRAATFCGYCGTAVTPASAVQVAPAMAMSAVAYAAPTMAAAPIQAPAVSDADLKPYYREEFARLDAQPGVRPKWNWAAFCFSAIWYLYHGMWAKALLLFGISAITGGAAGLFLAFYAGFRGNADFWLLRRKDKQLW